MATRERPYRRREERRTRPRPPAPETDPPPVDADEKHSLSDVFRKLASSASELLGSHWAFLAALAIIVGWAASGPFFDYSERWQLIINTGTTILTFLMVFLIQSTQNRDAKAIHLKLDELIRSSEARNVFADLEDANEAELNAFQREFEALRKSGKRGTDAMTEARNRALRRSDEPPDEEANDR